MADGRGLTGRDEAVVTLGGLHCASCVARAQRLLEPLASAVSVSLAARSATFRYDGGAPALSKIVTALDKAGFEPRLAGLASLAAATGDRARRHALGRIGVAVIGSMQVMMFAWPSYSKAEVAPELDALLRAGQWLLATPVVFYSGWPFLRNAARALGARALDMDVPVALSLLIAYVASTLRVLGGSGELYFDEATMFVMLLSVGRHLEGRTRERAAQRLRELLSREPRTATRITAEGGAEAVALDRLVPGDVVRVAPGEALPADGRLDEEHGDFDESLLTGETRPVRRLRGDAVTGGSLNAGLSPVLVQCTGIGAASRLGEIRRILARAAAERPRFQQLADRLAAHFVLAILVFAALGAAAWWPLGHERALSVALAVLVVSCPCALSLAMPAVLAAAGSRLAARGVLLARPASLERISEVDVVLFDKTGTLTEDGLSIAETHVFGELTAAQCLALAARLEHGLQHPVARAFGAVAAPAERVAVLPEGGVRGECDGVEYELSPATPSEWALARDASETTVTWLALRSQGRALAVFGLRAALRPDAARAVAELRVEGLAAAMVTGDAQGPAEAVAQATRLDAVHWRCSPEDKLRRVQALQAQGHRVLVVGDGINDAPCLAAADVSVAMPGGAAMAQAQADAILTGGSLGGLVALRRVAVSARRRIRENIAWALGYNVVMLPLALGGALAPWMAALGMSVSSLVVVANALRVRAD